MGDGQFVALCVGVFLTALFAFLSWVAIFWGNIDRSNLHQELRAAICDRHFQTISLSPTEKYDLDMIRRIAMATYENTGRLSSSMDKLDMDLVKIWKADPPPPKEESKPLTHEDLMKVRLKMEDKQ